MSDSQVTIKLTSDEALVLSHWLEKLQMTYLSHVVDDPAVWDDHLQLGNVSSSPSIAGSICGIARAASAMNASLAPSYSDGLT